MRVYEREHDNVDEKLYDLKNILIKYVHGNVPESTYNEVIFELFRLEKDIQDHTRIENKILVPLVVETENSLLPRASNSRNNGMPLRGHSENPIHPSPGDNIRVAVKKLDNRNLDGLSRRELEVLQLVACGYLNKEIADKLSISMHTVISHRQNITQKLQIKTVPGLTIYALLNDLIASKY